MSQFHSLVKTQPPQVTALNLPPNLSCVLLKKRTISVEPAPLPILQPDGVLVKIISTGKSGSLELSVTGPSRT
jgi:D-xylulose reductase